MTIEGNHWTVRLYRDYAARGGFVRDPENLCRFLRVITIWAPIRWLFRCKEGQETAHFVTILVIAFVATIVPLFVYVEAMDLNKAYTLDGWIGVRAELTPGRENVLQLATILGVVLGVGGGAIAVSGLWRLYRAKYAIARATGTCPFIEVGGEQLLLPVEMEPPDKLLEAAKEAERYIAFQCKDYETAPGVLLQLQEALEEAEEK